MDQVAEIGLDQAAAGAIWIERNDLPADPALFQHGSVTSGPTVPADIARAAHARPHVRHLRSVLLEDVVLDPYFGLIFRAGARVRETHYMVSDHEYATVGLMPDPLDIGEGPVAIGFNRNHKNYFHWLTQCLPAIDWYLRQASGAELPVLLPPLRGPWQLESLRLLGYGDDRFFALDLFRQVRLRRALYSEFLCGAASFAMSRAACETYRRIASHVAPDLGPPMANQSRCPRILYVARTDSDQRPMVNEAELVDLMHRRGADILVASKTPFADQVRRFRAADIVIAPHGAGLANLGFCRPETSVYEMIPAYWWNPCFKVMSQALGLHHRFDLFLATDDAVAPDIRPWRADLALVDQTLWDIAQARS